MKASDLISNYEISKNGTVTQASIKTGISVTSIANNLAGLSKKTKIGIWEYLHKN